MKPITQIEGNKGKGKIFKKRNIMRAAWIIKHFPKTHFSQYYNKTSQFTKFEADF